MLSRDERKIKHLKAKLARGDAIIIALERENDALSHKLHKLYSGKQCANKPPAAECDGRTLKDIFWRRYVNGGSRIWRVLFEICDSWGRLWQIIVQVGQKKHRT